MIKIGTDVEFVLFNTNLKSSIGVINFNDILEGGHSEKIGIENDEVGELRPKESTSGLKLAKNLFELMIDTIGFVKQYDKNHELDIDILKLINCDLNDIVICGGNIGKFKNIKNVENMTDYYSGIFKGNTPLGGHIHISTNTGYIDKDDARLIDGILLLIACSNSTPSNLLKRLNESYGGRICVKDQTEEYHASTENSWWELRSMPSQLNCLEILPALYEFTRLLTLYTKKSEINYSNIKLINDDYDKYPLDYNKSVIEGLNFLSNVEKGGQVLRRKARNILYNFLDNNKDNKELSIWMEIIEQLIGSKIRFDKINFSSLDEQRDYLHRMKKLVNNKSNYIDFIRDYLNDNTSSKLAS